MKIYAVDPEAGLVRDNGDEVISFEAITCGKDEAGNRACPYAAMSWDDLRTLIELSK
jgi:hypothetical protein